MQHVTASSIDRNKIGLVQKLSFHVVIIFPTILLLNQRFWIEIEVQLLKPLQYFVGSVLFLQLHLMGCLDLTMCNQTSERNQLAYHSYLQYMELTKENRGESDLPS